MEFTAQLVTLLRSEAVTRGANTNSRAHIGQTRRECKCVDEGTTISTTAVTNTRVIVVMVIIVLLKEVLRLACVLLGAYQNFLYEILLSSVPVSS